MVTVRPLQVVGTGAKAAAVGIAAVTSNRAIG